MTHVAWAGTLKSVFPVTLCTALQRENSEENIGDTHRLWLPACFALSAITIEFMFRPQVDLSHQAGWLL